MAFGIFGKVNLTSHENWTPEVGDIVTISKKSPHYGQLEKGVHIKIVKIYSGGGYSRYPYDTRYLDGKDTTFNYGKEDLELIKKK